MERRGLRDEMAAEAEGAFAGVAGPDGFEIDADGGKNGDVEDGEEILGEFLGMFEFESDAAKAEIEDAGAAAACFADDGVSIGAGHGNAFGFALHGVGRRDGCNGL